MGSHYSQEFRDRAVDMVINEHMSVRQAATDLGVNVWTLRDWLRARRSAGSKCESGTETLEEENKRLKKEISVLRQEREILKKAAAYFAKEQL